MPVDLKEWVEEDVLIMDGLERVSVLVCHFWCLSLTKMGLVGFGEYLWFILVCIVGIIWVWLGYVGAVSVISAGRGPELFWFG